MTVLILTCAEDVTADMVVRRLNATGVPVLRVDPADFPRTVDLAAVHTAGGPAGRITTDRRTTDLREIRSIWVRRPGRPGLGAADQPAWTALESDHAWYGTLRALPAVRWMNHPDAHTACRYKMWQLSVAESVGLTVPTTLLTTQPSAAGRFAADHGPLVCKSVSGRAPDDPPLALPTTAVPADADFAGVAGSATCLQHRVEKVYDVRLTVVGDRMFCARTEETPAGRDDLDWRYADPDAVRWRAGEVPRDIAAKTAAFMDRARLAYGAFDFAVTGDGTWYFLECNASGQFGFFELVAGLPVSEAIADWLGAPGERGR
ncbi:MvdC/MvdD family ATP grasp protein [Streptomyces sp. ICBB 8177]|uniref:MvdC/MvdD family ATP grasp protein n=1 Tax=Streptomyces sp. ICBB 8177 TaxID=563922 RepID=UPI000D67E936|nr:hypothetical protein [Streptomyces sp. ICBB 8177]PWI42810.1 hypothetical protein CK485_11065 [Streptomyces sp. ICBB 8177]